MHVIFARAQKIKVFAREYVMIVVSIMTALALENAAQSYQHSTEAKQAGRQIDAEIQANIEELVTTIEHNRVQRDKLDAIGTALLADIKSGTKADILQDRIINQYKGSFNISLRVPTLRREAWDVAVANQAASHMPPQELKRYSIVYANMRDVQAIQFGDNGGFLDSSALRDAASDAQMGIADGRNTYRIIRQLISLYNQTNGNLINLEQELRAAAARAPKA